MFIPLSWWQFEHVGGIMIINHCVGDFFNVIIRSTSSQIRNQYLKLVSNIRHQHRFNRNIRLCRIVYAYSLNQMENQIRAKIFE